jgi:hypothetical protein
MSELTKKLIQFHKDVDKIEKNARANYGNFADLANVLSTVTPALLKNDLVLVQTFLEDSLVTTLRHVGGEEISSVTKLVCCDGRNATQEWGKAVTYQRRYSICSILGIVADMDMDGESIEPAKSDLAKPPAKKTVTKKAAPAPAPTPTPAPTATDQPLSKDAADEIISQLKTLYSSDNDKFVSIKQGFFKQFSDLRDVPLSQAITTFAHSEFILGQLLE